MANPSPSILKRIFSCCGQMFNPKVVPGVLLLALLFAGFLAMLEQSVTTRLQRNSILASLGASEIRHECSSDLARAREMHLKLLTNIQSRMDDSCIRVVSGLRSELSPKVKLTPIWEALTNAALSPEKAFELAEKAYEEAARTWARGKSPAVSIAARESRLAVSEARRFINDFVSATSAMTNNPSYPNAENVCMESRIATAMFLAAWTDYDVQERLSTVRTLTAEFKNMREEIRKLAGEPSLNEGQQKRLKRYANNIEERRALVLTVQTNGLPAARERMFAGVK